MPKKEKVITASGPAEIEKPEPAPASQPTPAPQEPQGPVEEKVTLADILKSFNARIATLEGSQAAFEQRSAQWMDKVEAALKATPGPQGQHQGGQADLISEVLKRIDKALEGGAGGGGRDELAKQIGNKFLDTTIDTAVRKVVKQMGGEVAEHMTIG